MFTYTAKTRKDLDAILVQFPRSTAVIFPPKLTGTRTWRATIYPSK